MRVERPCNLLVGIACSVPAPHSLSPLFILFHVIDQGPNVLYADPDFVS
jgi:hypothetical protein